MKAIAVARGAVFSSVWALGVVASVGGVSTPGACGTAATAAPGLGAHTDEVLRGMLGMGEAEIAALRAGGAFALG